MSELFKEVAISSEQCQRVTVAGIVHLTMPIEPQEVLDVLTAAQEKFAEGVMFGQCLGEFPMPGINTWVVGMRLVAFAGDDKWAICIEVLVANMKNVHEAHVRSEVYRYGSGIDASIANPVYRYPIRRPEEVDQFFLPAELDAITYFGKEVKLVRDKAEYEAIGLDLFDQSRVWFYEFLRLQWQMQPESVFCDLADLRSEIDESCTRSLVLYEWNLPKVIDIGEEEEQSEIGSNVCFQKVADWIAGKLDEVSLRSEDCNSHWQNWRISELLG